MFLIDLLKSEPVEFYSPHSPEKCVARINADIEYEGFFPIGIWRIFGGKQVAGSAKVNRMRLRKIIQYRNSFQTYFTGSMASQDAGTLISGRFGINKYTQVFMILWFIFLIIINLITWGMYADGTSKTLSNNSNGMLCFMIPIGMLVFGVLLVSFGCYIARCEQQFLADFIVSTLDAKTVSPGDEKANR